MTTLIPRSTLPHQPAAKAEGKPARRAAIDWRGIVRRATPFAVLILAGVLGIAAVAIAAPR